MAAYVIPLNKLPVLDVSSSELREYDFEKGAVILMNKPSGWSSFDIVKFVRNRIKIKKVGHAGTLDPLANGLLILCCGKATKSISQIQEMHKNYVATIRFGSSTPSYDTAMDPNEFAEWRHISEPVIRKILNEKFTGKIQQVPPVYSAIKIKGERLYKKARRGEKPEINERPVHIYRWDILSFEENNLQIEIECSKGTYIRSFAHDLGLALESRAHLIDLKRTKIGHFSVNEAFTPAEFETRISQ